MPRPVKFPLLVIDAGNSAVKFAKVARPGASPKMLGAVATAKLGVASAKRAAGQHESVAVCSVVPSASRVLKRAFPEARFIGPRTATGFSTVVDRKTIGADRLANVAAAHARYGGSVVVASFGTAATFDLIDARGVHRGGAIAPGWNMFAGMLAARTALLPKAGAARCRRFLGRGTREAMTAGVAGGYAALVSHLLAEMEKEARVKNPRIVFTGGEAPIVAGLLSWKAVRDPLLTLRGVALLAQGVAREASK